MSASSSSTQADVVVIGGSAAGLSAAMTLGRSLRRTVVVDANLPANRFAPRAHNLITLDGTPPAEIVRAARLQVEAYASVSLVDGCAVGITRTENGFIIQLEDGHTVSGRRLLLATGVKDLLPEMPGYRACWGRSIIHCPYCHGYEHRGRPTGILVNDEGAGDFLNLVSNWTDEVTILTNGEPRFDVGELEAAGVRVNSRAIAAFAHEGGAVHTVEFAEGGSLSLATIYHRPAFELPAIATGDVGCELSESGHLAVDGMQRTSVAGVYAAGDCTTPLRSLAVAMAQGSTAGAALNHELILG